MSVLLGVLVLVFVAMAAAALRAARRGSRVLFRLAASRPKGISDIADGPIEIEGTIHAVSDPVRAPSGRACVVARTVIATREGRSLKSAELDKREMTRATKAVVRDATGEIAVDLEHVVVSAPIHTGGGLVEEVDAAWTEGMRGAWLWVTETAIEDGASVVVSGRARTIRSDAASSANAGYRGAEPTIVVTRQIEGTEADRLVVSDGSRSTLIRRAALPVVLLVVSALACIGYAAGAVVLLSW